MVAASDTANCPAGERPGVTDEGLISAANIARLGAIAVATLNTTNSVRMAKLQKDIADKYQQMANESREYFNDTYKPCEQSAVAEACSAPLYERKFDKVQIGRMLVSVKSQARDAVEKAVRCKSRYCTGQMAAAIKDGAMAQAGSEATVYGLGLRYEEDRERARNDVRWNRRAAILNIGRDLAGVATEYAQLAAGIFGRLGDQSAQGAAGAMSWLGYSSERRATMYPVQQPYVVPQSTRAALPEVPLITKTKEGAAKVSTAVKAEKTKG